MSFSKDKTHFESVVDHDALESVVEADTDTATEVQVDVEDVRVSWMFGDLNPLAYHDPFRWSEKVRFKEAIADMRSSTGMH